MKQTTFGNMIKHGAILFFILFGMTLHTQAQVTIGIGDAPHEKALLDLKENNDGTSAKGLLLPRVALTSTTVFFGDSFPQEKGMFVYNTNTVADVTPGIYTSDGSRWVRLVPQNEIFFYAPAVAVPTDTSDPAFDSTLSLFTVDLYAVYLAQFGLSGTNSAKSRDEAILPIVSVDHLDYFVTYFDDTVFTDVDIDENGILKYKLTGNAVNDKTFFNVVFKIK